MKGIPQMIASKKRVLKRLRISDGSVSKVYGAMTTFILSLLNGDSMVKVCRDAMAERDEIQPNN